MLGAPSSALKSYGGVTIGAGMPRVGRYDACVREFESRRLIRCGCFRKWTWIDSDVVVRVDRDTAECQYCDWQVGVDRLPSYSYCSLGVGVSLADI